MTFIIYEKLIHSPFCGDGIENIIASDKSGKILAPYQRLAREKLSTAQEWAWEVTND